MKPDLSTVNFVVSVFFMSLGFRLSKFFDDRSSHAPIQVAVMFFSQSYLTLRKSAYSYWRVFDSQWTSQARLVRIRSFKELAII